MKTKHLMTGYAIVLLLYAGWRSFDYMAGSLKDVGQTTAFLIAVIFLFASEIGLLFWLHFAQPNSSTDIQETTSNVMIGINFAGSMVLGLADLLKHNTLYTINLEWLDPVLLLAPWILVAANVLGHIIYHLTDSDEQLKRAERRLAHEEASLEIDARRHAVNELNKNRQALAEKLAPHFYGDLVDRVEGRTLKRFQRQARTFEKRAAEALPELTQPPTNGHNGHHAEPVDVNPTSRRRPGK